MKILVISDTHGNTSLTLQAYRQSLPLQAVIHLGDGAREVLMLESILEEIFVAVAGNCDICSGSPRELIWEYEGKKLLLVHGDTYGVKSGLGRLEKRACETDVDAVLFGHSHLPLVQSRSGILFVNPGTLISATADTSYAILNLSPDGISAEIIPISPI